MRRLFVVCAIIAAHRKTASRDESHGNAVLDDVMRTGGWSGDERALRNHWRAGCDGRRNGKRRQADIVRDRATEPGCGCLRILPIALGGTQVSAFVSACPAYDAITAPKTVAGFRVTTRIDSIHVIYPFAGVPGHVIDAKRTLAIFIAAHRNRIRIQTQRIQTTRIKFIAPGVGAPVAAARGIFPFSFAGQARTAPGAVG